MPLELPIEGGCICGKLRYRIADAPLAVFMCHCRNCQQRTGSAFALSMLTFRKDFAVTAGESLWRDLPGGSGDLHRQHICPDCFTRTHTEMLAFPDIINVRPGTLDDATIATPIAQAWTSLAHPWAIAPGVRCFEENPTDVEGLVAEWRGRLTNAERSA
ncbi:MAG: GFA family protein [Proteobacteria bacterium]|nr:GFA family protein [Pseudomonadota bacterium]